MAVKDVRHKSKKRYNLAAAVERTYAHDGAKCSARVGQ